MRAYVIARLGSVIAAAACLLLGYVLVSEWLTLFAIPVMVLLWIASARRSSFWTASGLLVIYIVLAVVGIIRHAPALLMAVGCASALAGWDLSDPRGQATAGELHGSDSALEKSRLRSLAAAVGASLLLMLLATAFRVRLPFGLIIFLALLLTASVLYAVHYLRASASRGQ